MGRPARTLGALLVLTFVAACGDSPPGSICSGSVASAGAATITIGSEAFSYGELRWGQNNDCTPAGASVISVTIRGGQTQPADDTAGLGLCVPRPDRIGDAPIDLGDSTLVELVGASATGAGCTTTIAAAARPVGTVTFAGFCTATGSAYLIELSGQVAGTRTCGATAPTSVTMILGGRTRVVAQ